jgi:hypothetical protein
LQIQKIGQKQRPGVVGAAFAKIGQHADRFGDAQQDIPYPSLSVTVQIRQCFAGCHEIYALAELIFTGTA